jgi:hypothetical protein
MAVNAMLKRAAEAAHFLGQLSETTTDPVTRLEALIASQRVLQVLIEVDRIMYSTRHEPQRRAEKVLTRSHSRESDAA